MKIRGFLTECFCVIALFLGVPSLSNEFNFSVGLTNDHVEAQAILSLSTPIGDGPSWTVLETKNQASAYSPGFSIEFGYLYNNSWNIWAETSFEYSGFFKDSASSQFPPDRDGVEGGLWVLGKYSGFMLSHKIGSDHIQWNISQKKVSPYFGVGLGRFSSDFDVTQVPGPQPDDVSGKTSKIGFGVLIGDSKRKRVFDVGLFREVYRVQHIAEFPDIPSLNSIWYGFEVTQWKMKVAYSLSI